ncbi:AAA family ATPase [Blastococcus sp. Marseille-P5729]|uniref:cytidylate kinase-like family protein n=1 Tax=Blastococcus sp. Marseille-P5729 TaxID=2086582 RepID=UPI00131B494B|nr:cytidylate kinase-like family protein [Blastococcus sp. Marseille-P5729]
MTVITIASAFGLRGSHIGATVARTFGIPFVDRAIPRAIARDLGLPIETVMAQDGKAATGIWRIISAMAVIPDITGTEVMAHSMGADHATYKEKTEKIMLETARSSGGVFVGRAGVLVLREIPGALHVRLTGPREQRIAAFAAAKKISEKDAREVVETIDKARAAYGRTLYRTDLTDDSLYDLVLSEARFGEEATAELITTAARARDRSR